MEEKSLGERIEALWKKYKVQSNPVFVPYYGESGIISEMIIQDHGMGDDFDNKIIENDPEVIQVSSLLCDNIQIVHLDDGAVPVGKFEYVTVLNQDYDDDPRALLTNFSNEFLKKYLFNY
jgi:hypothetical protein